MRRKQNFIIFVIAALAGCVTIPQGTIPNEAPTPPKLLEMQVRDGRIKLGQSLAADVANVLCPPPASEAEQHSPYAFALYKHKVTGQLAIVYEEQSSSYGVTLNQHVMYMPMPMFGVHGSEPKAVLLIDDQQGILTGWRTISQDALTDFEFQYVGRKVEN